MHARGGARWLLVATMAAMTASLALSQPAFSQESRSFLERLFAPLHKRQPAPPERVEPKRKAAPQPAKRQQVRRAPAASVAPARKREPAGPSKLENARIILVVGDFTAGGLAEGLTVAFAEAPGVRIVQRANGSSGLVRDDYFDWFSALPEMLDEVQPSIVAIMIGANDRQEMRTTEPRLTLRSEAWDKVYEARAAQLASILEERRIPFLWVGQPPYGSARMSSDMVAFNDIYRRAAEGSNGIFVDIWDGFVDEAGAYVTTGPDINGQPARLRASDGINITTAGRRKIAFFAEKPLRRLLGDAANPDITKLEPGTALKSRPMGPARIDRTPPMALGEPELLEATELSGAVFELPTRNPDPNGAELIVNGIPVTAPAGRADDFQAN